MKILCPSCHNECQYPNNFCTICGSPLPQIEICKKCGHQIANEDNFCTYCGQPKESQPTKYKEQLINPIPQNNQQTAASSSALLAQSSINSQQNNLAKITNKEKSPSDAESFSHLKCKRINRKVFRKRLFLIIIAVIIYVIVAVIAKLILFPVEMYMPGKAESLSIAGGIFAIFLNMRYRIHDINLSSWYLAGYYIIGPWILSLIYPKADTAFLIMILLPVLILLIKDSYPYANKWGNPPEN